MPRPHAAVTRKCWRDPARTGHELTHARPPRTSHPHSTTPATSGSAELHGGWFPLTNKRCTFAAQRKSMVQKSKVRPSRNKPGDLKHNFSWANTPCSSCNTADGAGCLYGGTCATRQSRVKKWRMVEAGWERVESQTGGAMRLRCEFMCCPNALATSGKHTYAWPGAQQVQEAGARQRQLLYI